MLIIPINYRIEILGISFRYDWNKYCDEKYDTIPADLIFEIMNKLKADEIPIFFSIFEQEVRALKNYSTLAHDFFSLLLPIDHPHHEHVGDSIEAIEFALKDIKEYSKYYQELKKDYDEKNLYFINSNYSLVEWVICSFEEYCEEYREKKEIYDNKQIKRKRRLEEIGFIYILKSKYGCKIGKSRELEKRLNLFDVKLPFKIECILTVQTKEYHTKEKILHERYASKHLDGEWFQLDENDIIEIQKFLKTD